MKNLRTLYIWFIFTKYDPITWTEPFLDANILKIMQLQFALKEWEN